MMVEIEQFGVRVGRTPEDQIEIVSRREGRCKETILPLSLCSGEIEYILETLRLLKKSLGMGGKGLLSALRTPFIDMKRKCSSEMGDPES